ncbi:MAG: IS110 family transposase [Dehalococcoidia bacterium]
MDLERITNREAPELLGLFGVGSQVASAALVAVGDNFERLPNEAAFASLCGVSPIPASSGKINRHRLNRSDNRQDNAAPHRVVLVGLRYNQETKDYLTRRSGTCQRH